MVQSFSKELVIARYNENIAWAEGFCPRVYNKHPDYCKLGYMNLPNVGREAHTYLYHIVHRWDKLADFTVFCQGRNDDHKAKIDFNAIEGGAGIVGCLLALCREWDDEGRLMHRGRWKEDLESGKMKRAKLTMAEWFNFYLNFKLFDVNVIPYFPGAIFGVSKEAIKSRSKAFYENILWSLSHHENPEEAYYMERAWVILLMTPGIELTVSRMGVPSPQGFLRIL